MSSISNSNMALDLYNRLSYAGRVTDRKPATLNNIDTMTSCINAYTREGSPQELSTEEKIHTIFEEAVENAEQMEKELITFYRKNIDIIEKFGVHACKDLKQANKDLQELKVYGEDKRIFPLTQFFAQEGVTIVRNLPEELSKNLPVIKSLIDLKKRSNELDIETQLASTKEKKEHLESQLALITKDYDNQFRGLPIAVRGAIELEDGKVQNSMGGEFCHQDSQLQALQNLKSQIWDLSGIGSESSIKQEKEKEAVSFDFDQFKQVLDDFDQIVESFSSFGSGSPESISETPSASWTRATAVQKEPRLQSSSYRVPEQKQPVEVPFPNSNLVLSDVNLESEQEQAIGVVENMVPLNSAPSSGPVLPSPLKHTTVQQGLETKPKAADFDDLDPWVTAQPKMSQVSRMSSVHRSTQQD